MVIAMQQDFRTLHVLVIRPLVASLILAGYFSGLFSGTF